MALLAYDDPETSPMFHYLSLEYRHSVADALNSAVLGMLPVRSYKFWLRYLRRVFTARVST